NRLNPWHRRSFQAAGVHGRVPEGAGEAKTNPIPLLEQTALAAKPPKPPNNQTITFHWALGLFFIARARFFRPAEEELDTGLGLGVFVALKMQLGNMPELQPERQLAAQVRGGVFQGGK